MTSLSGHYLWIVSCTAPPAVLRWCRHCGQPSEFGCSYRFRLNANGGRLDAWLVYRCGTCSERWNCEIFERFPADKLKADVLRALQSNAPQLINRYAFDQAFLRSRGVQPVPSDGVAVKQLLQQQCDDTLRIALRLEQGCRIRLDKLLAQQLHLSRSAVNKLYRLGRLQVKPETKKPLRHPAQSGQEVILRSL